MGEDKPSLTDDLQALLESEAEKSDDNALPSAELSYELTNTDES